MTSEVKMPVVAWCAPSNPLNHEAFAWSGSQRPATHTRALVLQSDALAAIEAARVEALDQAYDAMFEVTFKKGRVDKATLFDAQTAIRKLKESGSLAKEAP